MAETEGGASVQRAAQAHSDFESPDPSQFLTLRKGDFLVILGEGDEHCASFSGCNCVEVKTDY